MSGRLSAYRPVIIALLLLFLVWEVITRSLVAYLAYTNPEAALWLRSTDPATLLNLADDKLNADATAKLVEPVLSASSEQASQERSYAKGIQDIEKSAVPSSTQTTADGSLPEPDSADSPDALTDADYAQVQTWVEQALGDDPLSARAFRILGQLAAHASDEKRTEALMRAASERSLQETLAIFWMMRRSYQDKHYSEAIHYADALLRTRPQLADHVMPMLGRVAENTTASAELKQLLATNPPWRVRFFNYLPYNVTDGRTPLEVLLGLSHTPNPSTDEEQRSYLDFLVQHELYELAYYSWLQFLPPEQLSKAGRLFNGSFEITPSGLPFDWVFKQGMGVSIKLAQRPDQEGEHALLIEFGPGRVDFDSGVAQLVLLPPGTYRFQGKYKADLVSLRGLRWSIKCVGETDPIGVSSTVNGSDPSWKEIDFSFTVPASDCPAQYVRLDLDARSASEQFVSGSVSYDDLSITREPDSAQSPG